MSSTLICVSSCYTSKPLDESDQPNYFNAVALLESSLDPFTLLEKLQKIEKNQGRIRTNQHWGARTLDLDILLFGQHIINHPKLTVPHYHMHARSFVLYPLNEIAPHLILPNQKKLASLLPDCPKKELIQISDILF
ncbi:UNVERIFIED_CONTAM: hypothetical protein GTU68_056401 [Idotea baltica]|nr:hypothetical protein [Idotea baltica]